MNLRILESLVYTVHFQNEKWIMKIIFEIYEGAGNYLFSMCEDCLFCDVGNNEIEKYWDESLWIGRKFVNNYPDKNILVIEMTYGNESYFYGF